MTKAEATERVQKLLALADPKRGGTTAECELAAKKARDLIDRYGLDVKQHDLADGRVRKRRVTVADQTFDVQWAFDVNTGAASKNVTVHRYKNRGDWLIEVDLTTGPAQLTGRRRRLP